MELTRTNYSSGAPLEEKVGYSRMVKVGPFVSVGGTTSVQPDGTVYGETAYEQTKYVLEKQVKLLEQAGASAADVIKVKVYATDMKFGGEICSAYAEIFHDIRPLCTVVGTPALNRPTQFVEIEMEAVVGCAL
ncbi:MAG: Rid family hydrolase [Intestinibacillus sp.]